MNFSERLLGGIDMSGGPSACWPWTRSLDSKGYGQISVGGRGSRKSLRAHRAAFEELSGPLPPGADLDHECHNRDLDCPGGKCAHRACCNPAHLAPATRSVNLRGGAQGRVTACKHGHPYTPENTYICPSGRRSCRACRAARARLLRRTNT